MTLGTKRDKAGLLLDWVTVRYSTVYVMLGVLVAIGVSVVFAYTWIRGRDEREARYEISAAEDLREEAVRYSREPKLADLLHTVDAKLEDAKDRYAGKDYSEARTSAIVAQNYAQKLIDVSRGENTTRGEVRFYKIEGEVRVKRAGQFHWEPADQKMLLQIGDQLKTSRNSGAQIIYFDGSITTIKPSSLLEIKDLYEEPITRTRRVTEKLNWGEVEASTRKPEVEGSFHEVTTGTAVARSEDASQFNVRSEEGSGVSEVTLYSGSVEVSSGSSSLSLSERERVKVSEGGVGAIEKLPMVPRLLQPADQKVFTHQDFSDARTTLVWDAVGGASRYRLQISGRALFSDTLVDNDNVSSTSVELTGLRPGGYYWRVAAVDGSGRSGPFSQVRKFHIRQARLDDSADNVPPRLVVQDFVQNGQIVIISGSTEPGATVWVDNEKVDVNDSGDFTTVVRLRREGANRIRLVSQDASGNESSKALEAFVDLY